MGLILACAVAACEIWNFIRSGKKYPPPSSREISKTNSIADADRVRADEFIRVILNPLDPRIKAFSEPGSEKIRQQRRPYRAQESWQQSVQIAE